MASLINICKWGLDRQPCHNQLEEDDDTFCKIHNALMARLLSQDFGLRGTNAESDST